MLANSAMFDIQGATSDEQEDKAAALVEKIKKTEFALKHAIDETDWSPPGYILDGLKWLGADEPSVADNGVGLALNADDGATSEEVNDGHE